MSTRNRYDLFWPPYVPVAERQAQARRQISKLKKKKQDIQPVTLEGRTIARSFWGKGWCTHLESFGDYVNRLPRGRSYVRNGSVCHLAISKGGAEALVAGSSLYQVHVNIKSLQANKWKTLKSRCTGRIGSLIELLQGRFSEEVMQTVSDRKNGLFPLQGEIDYHCNCPDGALMCKHVAAVMYGIGARLDTQPELLFLMRGIDPAELLDADTAAQTISGMGASGRSSRRRLSSDKAAAIFDIDLDAGEEPAPLQAPSKTARPEATQRKRTVRPSTSAPQRIPASTPPAPAKKTKPKETTRKRIAKKPYGRSLKKPNPKKPGKKPFQPSARSVYALRTRLGMSRAAFAQSVGVSPATIRNWETSPGPITPQARSLAGLRRLAKR